MEDDYWYNLKEENGVISIEKTSKKKTIDNTEVSNEEIPTIVKKKSKKPIFITLSIIIVVPLLAFLLVNFVIGSNNKSKYRTFMIYMVGSDLESSGSMATFDLNDIYGSDIDLSENNVLLMVGGSKKWHNFVKEDEIGIYELTNSGFEKVKSYDLSSMGSVKTLSNFLDYSTDKYKSEKYDLIFWNHGLGAIGLEVDEVSDDYLNIMELQTVFEESKFAKEKLELVIFNNCMSGNIHFASIMKNYAEYMVASEEVMYVGAVIDRLNFLSDVKKSNNGYDIGMLYVNKSDESIRKINLSKNLNLDSTLSIIDLSKISDVEEKMNKYFNSIELDSNYRLISRLRRRAVTYGGSDYSFDTVDLFTLSDLLSSYADSELKSELQNSINKAVVYNSSLNNYSKGIAVYFPYYGNEEYIESHLYAFDRLWNNDYLKFIHNFVDYSNGAKRANRAKSDDNILHLTNNITYDNNTINLELTNEEKDSFEIANVYVFQQEENNLKLLLKSDNYILEGNTLKFNNLKMLKTSNNEVVSSSYENGTYKIKGLIDESDVIIKLQDNNGIGSINQVLIDSKDKPNGGLIDYENKIINYYSINYNKEVNEEWDVKAEKSLINNVNNELTTVDCEVTYNYVLIEIKDNNNDTFYSKIIKL